MHPKILELVLNLQSNALEHSNQICIATLSALRDFLHDYQIGGGEQNPQAPLSRPELISLQEAFVAATSFIRESKRLHEGVLNALEEVDRLV